MTDLDKKVLTEEQKKGLDGLLTIAVLSKDYQPFYNAIKLKEQQGYNMTFYKGVYMGVLKTQYPKIEVK